MSLLKSIARYLLRKDLSPAASIIIAISALRNQVEKDLVKALADQKFVEFQSVYLCGNATGEPYYVTATPELEHYGQWLRLHVRCNDADVLALVAAALRKEYHYSCAEGIKFEGPNAFCCSIDGVHGKLVSDYRCMLNPSND